MHTFICEEKCIWQKAYNCHKQITIIQTTFISIQWIASQVITIINYIKMVIDYNYKVKKVDWSRSNDQYGGMKSC